MTQSSQNARQPGLVAITTSQQLSSLFVQLQAQPALASRIKAFEWNNGEVTAEQEVGDSPRMLEANIASIRARCNADVTYILEQITQRGQLQSFKFVDDSRSDENVEVKTEAFWTALAGASTTLKHLSFDFATHELHELRDLTLFPAPFAELLTLHFDLAGGHGDDASQIHHLLHSTQQLTSLSLQLPNCDLESCRIKGLTYDYHFPHLTSFSLHGWVEPRSRLAEFLLRHPSISTLRLSIYGDEEDAIEIASTALPHLRALSIEAVSTLQLLPQLLSSSASRHITHLRLEGWHGNSVPILANAGRSLKFLALSTYQVDEWREDPNKLQLRELLPALPELLEVALHCPTGNTSWRNDAGERVHPAPLDLHDLHRLLSSFPSTTKIRAVRMEDERGLPLPADFLADLSGIAPPSLEYVRWDIDGKQLLYKLGKMVDGRIEARECEPVREVRPTTEADKWTSESILDHLN